uniref:Uncharacterized protein n=1 Tax=Ananas comosus var. bracteatus TaxID=296719 RepID=A0A6V7PUP9_ANACO|nr:unnamed protein product [Ananas comosus var. bracteatus]
MARSLAFPALPLPTLRRTPRSSAPAPASSPSSKPTRASSSPAPAPPSPSSPPSSPSPAPPAPPPTPAASSPPSPPDPFLFASLIRSAARSALPSTPSSSTAARSAPASPLLLRLHLPPQIKMASDGPMDRVMNMVIKQIARSPPPMQPQEVLHPKPAGFLTTDCRYDPELTERKARFCK